MNNKSKRKMGGEMDDNLHEAERIAALLEAEGAAVVVIGAVALAAHRYVQNAYSVLSSDSGIPENLAWPKKFFDRAWSIRMLRVQFHHYDNHLPANERQKLAFDPPSGL